MYFHSQTFLYLFLPMVLIGYYALQWLLLGNARTLRTTAQNAFLFVASVFFYTWGERGFVLVLLGSLAANYAFANAIARNQIANRSGKRWLVAAIVFDLGLLVYFKYMGFLAANLSLPIGDIHLPIGISFFTFQAISYVTDVYRREVPAQQNFLRFGLYVFLFPHLIAGPIVRYKDIASQLSVRCVTRDTFAEGVRRLILGLAKKVLIADTLAVVADQLFQLPASDLTASAAWLGMVCYALQIYFDFSGYSDMAIGLGKMIGFDFLENFNYPYTAASVTEFWRRWHISLSSWFRDYVYVPLGGNRGGKTYRNLLIVFVLCGVWHGANWTYLIWGVLHGVLLIIERLGFGVLLLKLPRPLRHVYTLVVVTIGWTFFRAQTPAQAVAIIGAMFGFAEGTYTATDLVKNSTIVAIVVGAIAALPVHRLATRWQNCGWGIEAVGHVAKLAALIGIMLVVAAWLAGNTYSAFIYFRF